MLSLDRDWRFAHPDMSRVVRELYAMERELWSALDAHRPRTAARRPGLRERLVDEGSALAYHAELPGVAGDAVEVRVEGATLHLRAERRVDAPEGYKPLRTDRHGATLSRAIELPCPVDIGCVTAELRAGVLSVRLPKVAAAAPRSIPVSIV